MTCYKKVLALIGLWSSSNACSEIATPDTSPESVSLAAVSPTSLFAAVGSGISELPAVFAHDDQGNPVSGVEVVFGVEGGGAIVGSNATTSLGGIARLAAWTVRTTPGPNKVTATSAGLPPVTFTVTAVTGPPAFLNKLEGDNQRGASGKTLPIAPAVRLTDGYGNPVPGVSVNFVIETGGGSLSGDASISDSDGVARAGSWTVGQQGPQVMSARTQSLPMVFFTATVRDQSAACAGHGLGESQPATSTISVHSCEREGSYYEAWEIELPYQRWLIFDLESSEFEALLELRDSEGRIIATRGPSNLPLRALLPAGKLVVVATTNVPGQTGDYRLGYRPGATEADCDVPFVTRGVSRIQQMIDKQCDTVAQYEDRYRVHLDANSSVTIRIDDWSYSDPFVELLDEKGQVVSTGAQQGYYVDVLSYHATTDGIYTIRVSTSYGELIKYTLTVN